MQRDLKVGLSLGVLVLGVVGALLFRREHVSDTPAPTLKTARKIDERIAEGPRTPYMTGEVEFDQEDAAKANDARSADQELTDGRRPAHTVPPSWMNDDEDPFQITRTDQGKFDFRHRADLDPTDITPLQPTSAAKTGARTTQAAAQTHVIESGDSLSVLAERYLGSQGRFQEIYEANRDVLTDVNRLPVGATIVIPPDTKTTTKLPNATAQTGTSARATPGHSEKVRSTITDISTFEPLAPPDAETKKEQTHAATEKEKTPDAAPQTKLPEAKKFVPPTRLPFANRNASAAHHKTSAPEASTGTQTKPAKLTETSGELDTETRSYQVRKGDSLEKISTRIYGNSKRAGDIFAANRSTLASPDALREGQELVLPE